MKLLTFWDHVDELRKMLIRVGLSIFCGVIASFFFHQQLLTFLLAPFDQPFYLFNPMEGFLVSLKLSFWGGVLISSPFWLTFLFQFTLPALKKRERRLLVPFLLLSFIFIAGGVMLAYKATLPIVIHFFKEFNAGLGENMWGLGETLHFTLMLILGHGFIFELYVGLLFLIHYKIISVEILRKMRRLAIVIILTISAILTPPDILSQILLSFPMIFLFETAIIFARYSQIKSLKT